jgi:hypothetical protein
MVKRLGRMLVVIGMLGGIAKPAVADAGGHCVYRLVPIDRVGTVVSAVPELVGCFGTYESALEAGLGHQVDAEPGLSPDSLTDEALDSFGTTASVVIGTEWDGSSFTGESRSYTAATTCSAGTTWQVANVGAEFNDRFQSGKGFGGCDTNRKFQHENFGGTVRLCTPNCTDYGALSNQVTSLRWRV